MQMKQFLTIKHLRKSATSVDKNKYKVQEIKKRLTEIRRSLYTMVVMNFCEFSKDQLHTYMSETLLSKTF